MGFLASIDTKRKQAIKDRVLNNRTAVLDIMGKNIKGARQCPFMVGQKCIGEFCEHFMEFKTTNTKTGQEVNYWRCAHVQTPLLIIELNRNIRALIEKLGKHE